MSAIRRLLAALGATVASVALSGCLGSGDDGAGHAVPKAPTGTQFADPSLMKGATGTVKWCTDRSTTHARTDAMERFNQRFAGQHLRAEIVTLPRDTAEQHRMFVDKTVSCDVFDSDVIWTADLAARGRVYNMRPFLQYLVDTRKIGFIPSTLDTIEFDGRPWGVPHTTNAGFLFYDKTDALSRDARATWGDVYRTAGRAGGIAYQAAAPEPLTVNFLEIAFAAGGRVLSHDGSRSVIDSPENERALKFMVDGIGGAAPRKVLQQDEDASLTAFEGGATFMRNWPDKYRKLSDRGGKAFGVMPLPIFDGAGVAGVLGGANLVVDSATRNPGGALRLIEFLVSPEQQTRALSTYSEPSVLVRPYHLAEVKRHVPFADELLRAIRQGRPRPVSPAYAKISDAISRNVSRALQDPEGVSPKQALHDADREIDAAIAAITVP